VAERAKNGPYKGMEDFQARLPARNVNKTVRANLELVGAFAKLEGGPAPTDDARRDDQLVLCPDIMMGGTIVTREIPKDKATKDVLIDALNDPETRADPVFASAPFVAPRMGTRPKFMAVFDGPTGSDVKAKNPRFASGNAFETLAEILDEHGLELNDGYWTGLNKVPKAEGEKFYTGAQIAANSPILKRELELLKPQVVLTLGTAAMRFFDSKVKGGCQDNAGRISYHKESSPGAADDFNLVIGITPGMLYFDPSRAELLEKAVAAVAEMVL
jgi:DNA polymerase-3 subunit alpha